MSYAATHEILRNLSTVNAGQKLVLSVIASYASNKNLSCFPSVATIAENCRLSSRSVQRYIASLVNLGLLERVYRKGTSAITRLKLPSTPTPTEGYDTSVATGYDTSDTVICQVILSQHNSGKPKQVESAAIAAPVVSVIEIPEPPTANIPVIEAQPVLAAIDCTTLLVEVIDTLSVDIPLESSTVATAPSEQLSLVNHPTEVIAPNTAQVVDADPLAGVEPQLLEDWGQVRKHKKKTPRPTRTEALILAQEAAKAGLTVRDLVFLCCIRQWSFAKAEWITSLPPELQPAPAAPTVWTPEPHTPASPETVKKHREWWAQKKKEWGIASSPQ